MRVTSLASGSSGNAYLIETMATKVLIDAGITLAALETGLRSIGADPAEIDYLLLTHEHRDHLCSAGALARRYGTPVLGTEATISWVRGRRIERVAILPDRQVTLGDLRITGFSTPHDGEDPLGFHIEHEDTVICLATDLGHVPEALVSVLAAADLLILEANHDLDRLWQGPYPRQLKLRVASPRGHLSNEQTAECLLRCAGGKVRRVWLAHLSEINNSPTHALRGVAGRLRREGCLSIGVEVALRDTPSLRWSPEHDGRQLALFPWEHAGNGDSLAEHQCQPEPEEPGLGSRANGSRPQGPAGRRG